MSDTVKTLQDIADLCSVSVSTVSRVLNHEPGISKATVRRVMEVAQRHHFSPPRRKRPLTRARLRLVVVVPDPAATVDNPFFDIAELVRSVTSVFSRERKAIETVSFSELSAREDNPLYSCDGVVFAFGEVAHEARGRLTERGIPYIFLNRAQPDDNYVSCNHYKGTLRLTEHLIGRGYTRIGYLGCPSIPVNTDRRRGYETAIGEALGRVDRSLMSEAASVGDVNRDTARTFVGLGCDAVVCFNDNFAIRFIQALGEIGVPVPSGMGVTGFDDAPTRKVFSPSITTMSLSTFDMGFFAARWLRDNIQHRESRRIQLEVSGTLIVGESTERGIVDGKGR